MQNFGGQTKSIMVFSEVAYTALNDFKVCFRSRGPLNTGKNNKELLRGDRGRLIEVAA